MASSARSERIPAFWRLKELILHNNSILGSIAQTQRGVALIERGVALTASLAISERGKPGAGGMGGKGETL